MTTPSALHASSFTPLPDLAFLGAAPVFPGVDPASYDTLLARLIAEVGPGNVMEQAWTRDAADLICETLRLRWLKAELMNTCADEGMQKLLESINVRGNTHELARRWAAREPEAVAGVEAALAGTGLDISHAMAATLALRIAEIERIDRMAASAEARRNATIREIVRHREHAPFAARLRKATAARIADGESTAVAAPARSAAEAAA
jgi:hypothetical protein